MNGLVFLLAVGTPIGVQRLLPQRLKRLPVGLGRELGAREAVRIGAAVASWRGSRLHRRRSLVVVVWVCGVGQGQQR